MQDEEDKEVFDDAPGWERGEEWGWVGMAMPESLKTSQVLRIPLYPSSSSSPCPTPSPAVEKPPAFDEESRQPSYLSTATSTSNTSGPDESLPLTPRASSPPCHIINGDDNGKDEGGGFAKPLSFTDKLYTALGFKAKTKSPKQFFSKKKKENSIPPTSRISASVPAMSHPVLKRPLGKGEQMSEWPCLVTGGEEWEGKRGNAVAEDGIKVENVV